MITLLAGLAYFVIAEPIEAVARRYAEGWSDWPVTVDGTPGTQVIVSAFHTREGVVESVVLSRHRGRTLGFWVERSVRAPPVKADRLPAAEGALFTHEVVTAGDQQRTLVVALAPEAAERARVDAWRRLGYRPSGPHALQRGRERVQLTAAAIDEGTSAVHEAWVSE